MKRYKIHICAFIFSIFIFVVGNITVDLYEKNQIEQKRSDLTAEGNKIANAISQYVNTSISISHTLSYIIAQNGGTEDIGRIVKGFMENYNFGYLIEIAPAGIIKYVYPEVEENDVFLNENIYERQPNLNVEESLAKYNKQLYVSDVLTLFSGEKAMIARAPVFLNNTGKRDKWGYVNCIIKETELKKLIKKDFEKKYKYEIYSINENKSEDEISTILSNTQDKIKDPEKIFIRFPNAYWVFSIDKESLVDSIPLFSLGRIITIFITIVSYITLYLLIKYPVILKEQMLEIRYANYKAKKSEEKYRSFFEMSPDYIFIINTKNNSIVEANKAFIESTGVKNISDIKYNEIFSNNKDMIYNILYKKKLSGLEVEMVSKDGEYKEVEINSIVLTEDDYPVKVLCVGRDLSEKRKMEKIQREKEEKEKLLSEALEYDKIKTEFFANMSHELRTPLNVILGSLQLVNLNLKKEGNIRGSVEKNNQIIKQNCYRLLRIISNIIDITKFDSNYLHLELKTLNIVSLVEDITLSIVDYARSKEINVEFDTDIEEFYIKCDSDKIERIILNLLSNAIKFTRANDSIFVNIYDLDESIRICIKDTGIGIPQENLNTIFERFRQVNKSFIREHEGSGIGLSLVKSLVEMHGGNIWVESVYGEGSEFYINLPKNYFSTDAQDECAADLIGKSDHDLVEKISIEFSDIYFN
ncbi:ATP-binding protein [Clostridium cylindrosporum]|uniref:histidine kinase n=1 Tax=Clostridium cylindrosporum DSM 605 TaxID=1121307 RepID=A0A0J8D9Z1_CLOCY|nr:ATP-binding protein [Clostridium cylindrosporum]KMT21129.1 sensor histidine kinase ResE [Clostridium cylindrosporum DSM 605]